MLQLASIRFGIVALWLIVGLAAPGAARAQMGPGDAYDPAADDNAPIPRTWWDMGGAAAVEAGRQADLRYVEGMRPHHAGALTLSRDYLADPEARNAVLRALAQSIIPNQGFEIVLLDEVGRLAQTGSSGPGPLAARPMATERMGFRMRFQKSPPPGLGALMFPGSPITARDVRFAKEMAVHHRAAVRMAQDYNSSPQSRNGYLKLLNVNIITDQTQEIAVMDRVVAAYPGDANAIVVDPSTIPGMEHMMRGGGMDHGGSHAPQNGAHHHQALSLASTQLSGCLEQRKGEGGPMEVRRRMSRSPRGP